MLHLTLVGALCMVGTIWLVLRAAASTRAAALAIGVLTVYAWSLLSMLTTLARTTLLSYRLQPALIVLLSAAGVFGFVEATSALARRYDGVTGRRIVVAAGVLGAGSWGSITGSDGITGGGTGRSDRNDPAAERNLLLLRYTCARCSGRSWDLRGHGSLLWALRLEDGGYAGADEDGAH